MVEVEAARNSAFASLVVNRLVAIINHTNSRAEWGMVFLCRQPSPSLLPSSLLPSSTILLPPPCPGHRTFGFRIIPLPHRCLEWSIRQDVQLDVPDKTLTTKLKQA